MRTYPRTRTLAGVALLVLALAACAPKGLEAARSALRTNDLPTARALLEADRERFPKSVPVRLALGEVYYRSARDALDWDGDEGAYLAFLEKAVDEFVRAAALDPKNPQPFFYLAMIDIYRGDSTLQRGLRNTRRLGFDRSATPTWPRATSTRANSWRVALNSRRIAARPRPGDIQRDVDPMEQGRAPRRPPVLRVLRVHHRR
jgi:hypothetical protein